MDHEPPNPPNPVIQKIEEKKSEEKKTLQTNDQPRLQPQDRNPAPNLGPPGAVGTQRTQWEKEAALHNAQIMQRQEAKRAKLAALKEPNGMAKEFNERSRKL